MRDCFSTYHPIINFTYFAAILAFSMFVRHPVFLGVSCMCALIYSVYLKGRKAALFALCGALPIFIISTVLNPIFNHEGYTLLFYMKNGNPVTLESILFGMVSGAMLVAVLMWFSCFNEVISSDKFIYLFGRIIPAVSLIISMVLRFVPKFSRQIKKVSDAQKCVGRDVSNGNILERAKHGMKILSIMTTWSLENSVETADSMKSRGYGLRGRTNFSIYRFDARDKMLLTIILTLTGAIFVSLMTKQVYILYFPGVVANDTTVWAVITYIGYGILCFIPIIIDILEDIKWHYLRSEI